MLHLFLLVLYFIASPFASPQARQDTGWNSPRPSSAHHALTANAGAGFDPNGKVSRPPVDPTSDAGGGYDPNG